MKFFVSFFIFGFLFSVSVQALAVCPDYKIVSPLEEQKQEEVDWCTFAASRVVTTHYGLMKSQCELVELVVGQPSCCANANSDPACHPNPSKWPHEVFNKVKYAYEPLYYLIFPTPPTVPPSWMDIIREICAYNRPLLAVASPASLPSPNWHAVVVEGYRLEASGEQKVRVFDPQEDLCDSSSCTDQNPRFLNYDFFFLSEVDHHTDYIEIAPRPKPIDTTPPFPPNNLNLR